MNLQAKTGAILKGTFIYTKLFEF